jgi:medium-chain acyl-[acyl-carrier-protein] hydrolase
MYGVDRERKDLPLQGLPQQRPREKTWIFGNRASLQQARWRLFCFPNAGGGASAYVSWIRGLAPEVDVYPVQLPGRENRLGERPIRHMDEMSSELAQALLPLFDRPFAFFGHSMGGLISFALASHLRQLGKPLPAHLFVSAYRAPHLPSEDLLHQASDDELVRKMLSLNGTQGEVFANPELRRMLLPIFRTDLEICETYTYTREAPLDIPLTAFGGVEDTRVSQQELEEWRKHTSKAFTLHMLPGDHFFWRNNSQPVWQAITQAL